MSITNQIQRLQNAKQSLKTAINSKLKTSLITNEKIDEFSNKINGIAIPSGEIVEGALLEDTAVGKNLIKTDSIYTSSSQIYKINANYFLSFENNSNETSAHLKKYENNKLVEVSSITLSNQILIRNKEVYVNDNHFYFIFVDAESKLQVIYGTTVSMNILELGTISNSTKVFQTDIDKFIFYNDDSVNKRITAQAVTINFNGYNTTAIIGNQSTIFSTDKTFQEADIKLIGENRVIVYLIFSNVDSNSACNYTINFGLYYVNSSELVKLQGAQKTLNNAGYTVKFSITTDIGKLYIANSVEDDSYYTVDDSAITYVSSFLRHGYIISYSPISKKVIFYQFAVDNQLYSYSGYTKIQETPEIDLGYSISDYEWALMKTSNNEIVMPVIESKYVLKVYSDSFSYSNIKYFYQKSLDGMYISVETGEAGDTIKMYSPSI